MSISHEDLEIMDFNHPQAIKNLAIQAGKTTLTTHQEGDESPRFRLSSKLIEEFFIETTPNVAPKFLMRPLLPFTPLFPARRSGSSSKQHRVILTATLLVGSCLTSDAAVTLRFTNPAIFRATNWLDSSGVSTTQMVWGIVVDTGGNGFRPGEYLPGFAYASGFPGTSPPPYTLQTESGATDDLLILSANLMGTVNTPSDSGSIGMNQITVLTSIPYASGNLEGFTYRVIWFDQITLSGTAQYGVKYGMFELPVYNTMPPDEQVLDVSMVFAGQDSPKSMTYQLVPEPSAALLSALGLISLLARRKCL